MDQCPKAIEIAQGTLQEFQIKGECILSTMEDFRPEKSYNCITMRYSIGYLKDKSAVEFLIKVKESLAGSKIGLKRP